jgi:hypothetical protein
LRAFLSFFTFSGVSALPGFTGPTHTKTMRNYPHPYIGTNVSHNNASGPGPNRVAFTAIMHADTPTGRPSKYWHAVTVYVERSTRNNNRTSFVLTGGEMAQAIARTEATAPKLPKGYRWNNAKPYSDGTAIAQQANEALLITS